MNRRSFFAVAGSSLLAACHADDLLAPTRIYMDGSIPARLATVKVLKGQVFPTKLLFTASGYDIQDCYFHQGYSATLTNGQPWSCFANNVVRGGVAIGMGHMTDVVLVNPTASNPHFLTPLGKLNNLVFDGLIFEYLGTSSVGDCFLLPKLINPPMRHHTLIRCLVLPNAAGNTSGSLVSQLGGPFSAASVLNCTVHTGGGGGLIGGETFTGYPGIYRAISGNIFWDTAIRGYALKLDGAKIAVPDLALPGTIGPNVLWNLKPGQSGYGMHWPLSSQPSGQIQADPMCANRLASLRTWDASLGGPGTSASGINRLLTQQNAPQELIAFLKAGFTPTNPVAQGFGAV